MTLLVLLAAAARAGVVAADLRSFVPDRLHRGIIAAHSRRLRYAMAGERRGRRHWCTENRGRLTERRQVGAGIVHDERLARRRLSNRRRSRRFLRDDGTHTPEIRDGLGVDAVLHLLE